MKKRKKKEKRCAGQGKLFEEGFTGSELLAKKGDCDPAPPLWQVRHFET